MNFYLPGWEPEPVSGITGAGRKAAGRLLQQQPRKHCGPNCDRGVDHCKDGAPGLYLTVTHCDSHVLFYPIIHNRMRELTIGNYVNYLISICIGDLGLQTSADCQSRIKTSPSPNEIRNKMLGRVSRMLPAQFKLCAVMPQRATSVLGTRAVQEATLLDFPQR